MPFLRKLPLLAPAYRLLLATQLLGVVALSGSSAYAEPPSGDPPPEQATPSSRAPVEVADDPDEATDTATTPNRGRRPWRHRREGDRENDSRKKAPQTDLTRSEVTAGFRGSRTSVLGQNSSQGLSLSAAMVGDTFVLDRGQSARVKLTLALGGGNAGVEGDLAWLTTVGVRVDFNESNGMFLRGGFDMYYDANKLMRTSNIQLPRGEFGFQHFDLAGTVFELGLQAGPSLVGRFGADDFSRKLGESFEYGGFAHLGIGQAWVDLSATRFLFAESMHHEDVNAVEGRLCAVIRHFSLCANARSWQTHDIVPKGGTTQELMPKMSYFGLQIGAGDVTLHKPE
ncbi:MAG: hypothetical protein U0165_01920 [Polyangiaceae bacterium]